MAQSLYQVDPALIEISQDTQPPRQAQEDSPEQLRLEILSFYTSQPRLKQILGLCMQEGHNELLVELIQKRKTMLSEKKILALLKYALDDSRPLAIQHKSKRMQAFFANKDIFSEPLSAHQESQLWLSILILQMPMYYL